MPPVISRRPGNWPLCIDFVLVYCILVLVWFALAGVNQNPGAQFQASFASTFVSAFSLSVHQQISLVVLLSFVTSIDLQLYEWDWSKQECWMINQNIMLSIIISPYWYRQWWQAQAEFRCCGYSFWYVWANVSEWGWNLITSELLKNDGTFSSPITVMHGMVQGSPCK